MTSANEINALSSPEYKLRRLLCSLHRREGCHIYGDDGELYCHTCRIDFRRNPPKEIERRLFELGLQRYEAAVAAPTSKAAEKA